MITNLREDFLYEKLPEAIIDLDERGLIQAVIGGFQDRLEDLRSYTRKLENFYDPGAFPETGNNVVLVDLQSDQGKAYTRSLDIMPETPPAEGSALTQWAADQLGLAVEQVSNVRYGVDRLRLVDANTLGYLASTLGAVLYQSSLVPDASQAAMQQELVDTWFPRLKIKGTVKSFEVLGRILGFDDVRMTPLWSRVSARKPEDVGDPDNDPDFATVPDFVPQQQLSPFYNPLETRDGPFFSWTGTVSRVVSSTQFYTQVVNGFSPFITVSVLATNIGTVTHPATGSYALAGGDAYTTATVTPPGSGIQFRALVEGSEYNGLYVHVTSGTGTEAVLSVVDRLSTVKYRSSYFDLGLTADMDHAAEVFGDSAVKANKDLMAGTNTVDGIGTSPFRPWVSGSIALPLVVDDWLTQTVVDNGSQTVAARYQAGAAGERELNIADLNAAGVQVAQALEEVRPATRFPRRTATGFLIDDRVPYAFYGTQATLFTTDGLTSVYSGSYALTPQPDYTVAIKVVDSGTTYSAAAAIDPSDPALWHYRTGTTVGLSGSYNFDTGIYRFALTPLAAGSDVVAYWTLTSTEVVRAEPDYSVKQSGAVVGLARPEDDEGVCTFYGSEFTNGTAYFGTFYRCVGYETIDEYPWRRDIVNGGELVEIDAYLPVAPDISVEPVDVACSFIDQTGCEYDVYALKSTVTPRMRYRVEPRATDSTYQPGALPIGYQGTFKNIATLTEAERALVNTYTDAETLFNPGYKLFHVGLVDGVLVADGPKFNGPHHRQNLIGWLPFNEHPEDALSVADQSAVQSVPTLNGVAFADRQWDDTKGWYLNMQPGASILSMDWRDWSDDQTVSFWFKAGTGTGISTVVQAGAVRFDYNADAQTMRGYVGDKFIGSYFAAVGTWAFVYVRKTTTDAWFGGGSDSIVEVNAIDTYEGMADTDALSIQAGGTTLGLHDLRVWNAFKSAEDMELVRYHAPAATIVNYPIGFMYTANRQDRYGLLVLPNGWVVAGDMPAWVRRPALALVQRYDSMGAYQGQSRFQETGLGGGHSLPGVYQLGVQYGAMTANGTSVVATEHGQLPGVNDLWLSQGGAGTYAASGTSPLGGWSLDLSVTLPTIATNASGAAYYAENDSVFVVKNAGPPNLYEFTASGALLRTITLTGFSDPEAVCYVSGSTFAIVDEDLSTITVFPILPATSAITRTHWLNIDTGFGNLDTLTGGGLEGLTYDSRRDVFWVAKERQAPATPGRAGMRIYTVGWTGSVWEPFSAYMVLPPNITDLSDLHYDHFNDHIYALSDEAKAIINLTTEGEVVEVLNWPSGMLQPEGLTFDTNRMRMWIVSEPNTMRRYVKAAVNGFGTYYPLPFEQSGTQIPWPNIMRETNPCRDYIWVEGMDGYVYEIILDGTLTDTNLVAQRIALLRTDAEINVNEVYSALNDTGTYYADWPTGWMSGTLVSDVGTIAINGTGGVSQTTKIPLANLVMAEQPTGAHTTLVSTGTYLTVNLAGEPAHALGGTDASTPPLYMYCNSRILAYGVSGTASDSAWWKWTDRGNSDAQQRVDASDMPEILDADDLLLVAARGNKGYIEFNEAGPLPAGRYSLKIESGNIGQTDEDFDGFNVEITVNATVLNKRLLADQQGFNLRGTDTFEFDLADSVAGNYLISLYWSNPYKDTATNSIRQLAVYSYELRRLAPELYKVSIGAVEPDVTQLDTANYNSGSTPGGWMLAINSYGTLAQWAHESTVFPANDTIESKLPLSSILTGDTAEKREDIMMPSGEFVLENDGSFTFSFTGSAVEAASNVPFWLTSGGITPDGEAVVVARMARDSSQVRVAICDNKDFSGDIIYSAMKSASIQNNWVVNCPVSGLAQNAQYFYAMEADGTLYSSFNGTFSTWDDQPRSFSFAMWACENSTALVSPSWPVVVASNPLFILNCGDLHYENISTNSPLRFYQAFDSVYSSGTRKDVFAQFPFAYVWDDHDFGANDSDSSSASVPAAQSVYNQAVPHYKLATNEGPIYQSFRVGRCQFIMTDLRSKRDKSNQWNYVGKTMMGLEQKAWFKQEILKANADPTVALIFWVTSVPWGGVPASDDHWCAYANERAELADFFKANNVTRLFLLFGDEHSQSIDDGRHTDWATGTWGSSGSGHGWPSFGVAPMGQSPSSKAGPYFIGQMWMSNPAYQFGLVTVTDTGSDAYVQFRGVYETGDTVNSAGTNMLWQFNGTESPRPI